MRLAVVGCTGQMGRAVVRLAAADPGFRVVAAVTVPGDARLGQDAGRVAGIDALGLLVADDVAATCDVLIEFTTPTGCEAWAAA